MCGIAKVNATAVGRASLPVPSSHNPRVCNLHECYAVVLHLQPHRARSLRQLGLTPSLMDLASPRELRCSRATLRTAWPWQRSVHLRVSAAPPAHQQLHASQQATPAQQVTSPRPSRDKLFCTTSWQVPGQQAPAHQVTQDLNLRFQLKDLPWHGKVLHDAQVQSAATMEAAVERAEEVLQQVPDRMQVVSMHLQEAVHQAMAHLRAWVNSLRAAAGERLRSAPVTADCQPADQDSMAETELMTELTDLHVDMPVSSSALGSSGANLPASAARQVHCSVTAVERPAPVVSHGPQIVVGLVLAGLFAAVVPRLMKRHWEEKERQRQLQDLAEMNALALRKQKQRFQQALQVDSINLELPDIKDAPVDPSKAVIAFQPAADSHDVTRQEWESFMMASKIGQVRNVWNAKEQRDTGAPRASKKQLEEMTARVRAANTGSNADMKRFISFEELCSQEIDFDAGMAERVAQRKVRFEGQFLTDQDVGLPSSPRKGPGAGPSGLSFGSASQTAGSSRAAGGSGGMAGDEELAARRRRLGLGEGRSRPSPSGQGLAGSSGAGGSGQLLEIRPKRTPGAQPVGQGSPVGSGSPKPAPSNSAQQQQSAAPHVSAEGPSRAASDVRQAPVDSSKDPEQQQLLPQRPASSSVGTSGRGVTGPVSPGLRMGLNGSSEEIDDNELKQSLALRGQLHYVHPSVASFVQQGPQRGVGKQPEPGPLPRAAAGHSEGSATSARPAVRDSAAETEALPSAGVQSLVTSIGGSVAPLAPCAEAWGAAPIAMGEAEPTTSSAAGDDMLDEALLAPVSGVSLGLLRGASRMRTAQEQKKTARSKAAEHDSMSSKGEHAPDASVAQQVSAGEAAAHLVRAPQASEQPTK